MRKNMYCAKISTFTVSEDNQKLRSGCSPDYQIDPTNLLSYLSPTNKNSSMRTSTTYI